MRCENPSVRDAPSLACSRSLLCQEERRIDGGLIVDRLARRLVSRRRVQAIGARRVVIDHLVLPARAVRHAIDLHLGEKGRVLPEVKAHLLRQPRVDLFEVPQSAVTGKALQMQSEEAGAGRGGEVVVGVLHRTVVLPIAVVVVRLALHGDVPGAGHQLADHLIVGLGPLD